MLITDNAYLILWLKGDEDDKAITKRYQALEKQIKVKLNKEYPYDLSFISYKKLRTLENIKKSFHNLTDLNNKLYQIFFRFNILDKNNLEIFNSYKNGFIKDALEIWETEYIRTNDSNYLLNYVIWGLLKLETDNKNIKFTENVQSNETLALKIPKYLKKILDSENFINDFIKRYNRNSNIKISKNKINDFIKSLPQYICEQFFTLWEKHWTFILYKWICKLYQISSKRVESSKKVLDEYKNIENNYSFLESPYTRKDTEDINKAAKSIINSLNELSALWIKENDPKLWKLRDNIATLLINFANKIGKIKSHEDENNLLTFAKKIAYSKRIKDKIIIKTYETTTPINENDIDNLRKRVIKQISSTTTKQVINDHFIIEKITETQIFLIHDNNFIAKSMIEYARKEIENILEKELGRKVTLNIQWMSKEEYLQRLMWKNASTNKKTEEKKNDKSKDEVNNLISSIYLSLDIIKKPLLLNNYSKLLAEIGKVNDMIKRIEASNLLKIEDINKIRDNIWEAILTAAKELYTKSWSYEKSYTLLQMAKKMSRSRWTLNKIINELNIMEDTERRIKGEKKKDTKYSTSNSKKWENNNTNNKTNKTEENKTNNNEKTGNKQTKYIKNTTYTPKRHKPADNYTTPPQQKKKKEKKYKWILWILWFIASLPILMWWIRIVVWLIVLWWPYLIYLLVNSISPETADSWRMVIIIIWYFIVLKIILEKLNEN